MLRLPIGHGVDVMPGPAEDPGTEEDRELVASSAMPSSRFRMTGLCDVFTPRKYMVSRVTSAAGTLPSARLPTICSHRFALVVDDRANRLRDRGVEKVGADRGRRMEAEQKHEQRRHQRAAADACQPDEDAHQQPGQRIKGIVAGKYVSLCSPLLRAGLCRKA